MEGRNIFKESEKVLLGKSTKPVILYYINTASKGREDFNGSIALKF